jgi:hypothetical protein
MREGKNRVLLEPEIKTASRLKRIPDPRKGIVRIRQVHVISSWGERSFLLIGAVFCSWKRTHGSDINLQTGIIAV